jgi:RimJ/RimL family protein N-acetyltransferase
MTGGVPTPGGRVTRPADRFELGDLTVRRVAADDAALVARTVGENLAHLAPFMPWATPEAATVEFQRDRREKVEIGWDAGTSFQYLLVHGTVMVGAIALERRVGPRGIELGYWLAASATGRGWVTHAADALTVEALGLEDVDRVEIHCDVANRRSRRVPERLGYRLVRTQPGERAAPGQTGRCEVWMFPA